MKKYVGFVLILLAVGFTGCETAQSSVRGNATTISTLDGYTYDAIVLAKSTWENVRIAKTPDDVWIYVNVMTIGVNSGRPGSAILYADGNRHDIAGPTEWDIDDVTSTAKYWSFQKLLDTAAVIALLDADTASIRVVGGGNFMGKDNGIDITPILPAVKEFITTSEFWSEFQKAKSIVQDETSANKSPEQ
jgi:hypothetical protein